MVAPKNTVVAIKEKPDGKKSEPSSPEPFQEPDGMTTIDLNKSDDYSKETEAERAKLKQKAQIRYVTRLLFFLGSIVLIVFAFIIVALLNKEYHLFTVFPLKLNQTFSHQDISSTPSAIEELVNLTKIFNQALFREKLKSENYFENSVNQMNTCQIEQTIEACCEIFKNTHLERFAELCTVNDMLSILLELQLDRRRKRQIFDHPQFYYQEGEYYREASRQPPNPFAPKIFPIQENFHHFESSDIDNPGMVPLEIDTSVIQPPPKPNIQPNHEQTSFQRDSPNIQSFFILPQRARKQILEHITNAPKQERNYVYEDFYRKDGRPRFDENEPNFAFEESKKSVRDFDDFNFVGGEFNDGNQNIFENAFETHHGKDRNWFDLDIHRNKPVANNMDFRDSGNQETLWARDFDQKPDRKQHNFRPEIDQQSYQFIDTELQQTTERLQKAQPFQSQNSFQIDDPLVPKIEDNYEPINTDSSTASEVTKKDHFMGIPTPSKIWMQVPENITTNGDNTDSFNLENSEDSSQMKVPPNFKITKKKDDLDLATTVLSKNSDFDSNSNMARKPTDEGIRDLNNSRLIAPPKINITNNTSDPSIANETNIKTNKPILDEPQKKPPVSKFGDNVQVCENITTNANNTVSVNLEGSEDSSQMKEPPNLKITKNKDDLDATATVLSRISDFDIDLNIAKSPIDEKVRDLNDFKIIASSKIITLSNTSDPSIANETNIKTNEPILGESQKKLPVSKFGDNVQVRKNITTNAKNTVSVNLEGSEDSSQMKEPPNLKITKNKDDLDATATVLSRISDFDKDLNIAKSPIDEKVRDLNDFKIIASSKIITHSNTSDPSIANEKNIRGNESILGEPQKKPLVLKFGDNMQGPENITTNADNTDSINLEESGDSLQMKVPSNFKITKNKDRKVTSTVLLRSSDFDSDPNMVRNPIDERVRDLNDSRFIAPSKIIITNNTSDPSIANEKNIRANESTLGEPQKKPIVSNFGDNAPVRENITTNADHTNSFNLESSKDSSQLKIPPNLKITKKKDDLDLATLVLSKNSDFDRDPNMARSPIDEGVRDLNDSRFIAPSKIIINSNTSNLSRANEKNIRANEPILDKPQKKPLVSRFRNNVEVRDNITKNADSTDLINLEESGDSLQIKVPPNDDLEVTTKILFRNSNFDSDPNMARIPTDQGVRDLNDSRFIAPSKSIIISNTSDPSIANKKNFKANEPILGELQKKPLVSKFGDNVEVFDNITTNTESINLESSEDSSQIKVPPNLKITKKKDDLEIITTVLPKNAVSGSDRNNTVFRVNDKFGDSRLKPSINPTKIAISANASSSSVNNEELSTSNQSIVDDPQKKPVVSKFVENMRVQENISSNVNNEDLISKIKDFPGLPTSVKIQDDEESKPSKIVQTAEPPFISSTPGEKPAEPNLRSPYVPNTAFRSNTDQGDFRIKSKQLDGVTAIEDVQSNQQALVNPCFYPYINPYMQFAPSPIRVGNSQDPSYLKIVSVSQPKVQNQPTYVLNPAMYYTIPPSPPSAYSSNPYLAPNYYPPIAQAAPNSVSHVTPIQVTAPTGQYYMCNPIPTPTNNIAGLAGVEVRRDASNLQNMMEDVDDLDGSFSDKSRAATLICPLGEQPCLDNSKCIKNHHICDSEVHCDDSSDEIACSCKERVGKLRMCDGYCDCPRCEDETGCFGCEKNEFSCDDWSRFRRSTCIPLVQRCDGKKQCEVTGKDEIDCSILVDHIGNFPLNMISNSVGFLHRNYKGKWYPTCFGTELWAAQVCQVEAGPSAIIPKAHMTLTTDPYTGLFINILPNNEISLVNTCVEDRAAFVECPPIYCGLRFLVNNPYRAEEVDTSIEDMLNDLERAYRIKENGFERRDLHSEIDLGRIAEDSRDGLNKNTDSLRFNLNDFENNNRKTRSAVEEDNIGLNNANLTQEHLEEVIEKLEKTFRRRDVSNNDGFSAVLKESRVVGGKASQPAAWPWLVSIYKNGIFHCGGVLINELWVVTASHCVDRYWQYYYEVQAGALRRFSYAPMDQRRWVKVVVPHEFYSKSNLRNDIALMKLSAPVRYNRYVRPICLPSESTAGQDFLKGPNVGSICTTVGWGATVEHGADPDHMREVEVPILEHCKHKEDSDVEEICAGLSEGGKDACQGDSGGPLMCRNPNNPNQWYLAGIVSHGEGCARPNEPGVYTKVSRYIGWIAENTREDKLTLTNPLQKCPGYICKGTKRCVTKRRRCDRIVDCLFGDDEINCENRFQEIFKHSRKSMAAAMSPVQPSTDVVTDIVQSLIPLEEFALLGNDKEISIDDGNLNVRKAKMSAKQSKKFEEIYFKCQILLQVIPIEKRCNKLVDCEDGTDELSCSCADYIKNIDGSAICDGVTDCPDISDESHCVKCKQTEFTCQLSQKCIDISKRCDGNSDCPRNEDEMNCISLTNGKTVSLDKDNRPMFKSRGIVTINHYGQWKPLCLNSSSSFVNDKPSLSTVICNLLGFDEYLTYHNYQTEDVVLNSSYSMQSGRISLMSDSQKCDNCCDGLYISCSNTSTSSTLHYKALEQAKELYFSPWTAAIYSNGLYKCMGTILDQFWIVTSEKCFSDVNSLSLNYVVAVLGKGKLNLPVKGPHEQTIRIGGLVNVIDTDIILLRLDKDIKFNRYVQAADLNARRDGHYKEKCYAIGQDNDNKTLFVPLMVMKSCLVGFRCFEKKIEEECINYHPWSGIIICDSRAGWYPAAVFHETDGYCGFSHEKKYTSVRFYRKQIFKIIKFTPKSVPPPICSGYQCSLGNCISEEKICNGINDCHDGEDEGTSLCYEKEKECHLADNCVCPTTHLKCPTTNKCHPKSSFCDRTNDCGEFEDEPNVCSCRNYLKLTNPEKICDGILNCLDRTDEDPEICSCKLKDFQCGKLNKCVPQEMVCDGVRDCPNGEDEQTCLSLKTEDHERTKAGEVMTRTAGIWHNGCFDLNYSTSKLEEICTKLGFTGSSASQLSPPHNLTTLTALRPIMDTFDVVWLRRTPGNKLRFRMRSGLEPHIKFVTDKTCHRLFIACI